MAITYTIDEAQSRVTLRYEGIITDRDLYAVYNGLYDDPGHRIGMDEVADCRAVDRIEVTRAGLQGLSAATALRLDTKRVPWRVAIVAPSDAVFGMARMYEAFRSESPEQVRCSAIYPARRPGWRSRPARGRLRYPARAAGGEPLAGSRSSGCGSR